MTSPRESGSGLSVSRLPTVLLLIALGLGAAPECDAQQPQEPAAEEEFFAVIDVEVVNIDVWVTDRDGNPITGLQKDDFVVLRDGQAIPTTNFYAVADGRPVAEPRSDTAANDGTDEAFGPAAPTSVGDEIDPEHRLWLILYIDNFNLDPIERDRVLPGVREFLSRTLKGDDRAMVVTYDRSLEVRQPFTANKSELSAALDGIRGESGLATIRRRDQATTLERIDRARDSGQALGWARQYADEQLDSVERTVEALERLIDSLAGLPGRKALIHVSSGVPMLAGEEMFHAVGEKFNLSEAYAEIPRHDASRFFERADRQANAHRVSFFTLDAGGMRGLHFAGAEYAGFINPRLRTTLDSIVPENLQSPLRLMALETGGRAIVNRNEALPALQKAALDFRSFYSLGIASGGTDAGSYHEIEVKLATANRKYDVRHRGGYRSKDTDTRAREAVRSALLYSHESNPLSIDVTWGRPEREDGRREFILPIKLTVPMRDVALLPIGGGRHETRLRLFVGVAGKDGELSQIDDAPLGLRIGDDFVEAARGEALVHSHKLRLTPGRKKIAVAILDLFGQQISIVTGFVQVGSDDPS